jgi:cytochrome c oxidase subunit I
MRRRIIDYDPSMPGFQNTHLFITIAGFMVAASVVILLVNMFRSAKLGEVATGNVWESRSPEWQIPSPTPIHNYDGQVVVLGDPYDYGSEDDGYVSVNSHGLPSAQPAD